MEILILIGVAVLVGVLVASHRAQAQVARTAVRYENEEGRRADDLILQLFMEGVHQGFAVSWKKQLHFERVRRKAHQERLASWFVKRSLVLVVLGVAVVGVPYIGVELPFDPYRYGAGAAGSIVVLAVAFFMPRYRRKALEATLEGSELE